MQLFDDAAAHVASRPRFSISIHEFTMRPEHLVARDTPIESVARSLHAIYIIRGETERQLVRSFSVANPRLVHIHAQPSTWLARTFRGLVAIIFIKGLRKGVESAANLAISPEVSHRGASRKCAIRQAGGKTYPRHGFDATLPPRTGATRFEYTRGISPPYFSPNYAGRI